jgi:hypothetical protein
VKKLGRCAGSRTPRTSRPAECEPTAREARHRICSCCRGRGEGDGAGGTACGTLVGAGRTDGRSGPSSIQLALATTPQAASATLIHMRT